MLTQILALTVTDGNRTVEISSWPFMMMRFLLFILFVVIFILLIWCFLSKKRLEHQQILAAIEKGTPLSELRPLKKKGADWIKNLTAGIAFLLIGLGLIIIKCFSYGSFAVNGRLTKDTGVALFIGLVFIALGISRVIRGILQRKYDKALSSEKSDNRVG